MCHETGLNGNFRQTKERDLRNYAVVLRSNLFQGKSGDDGILKLNFVSLWLFWNRTAYFCLFTDVSLSDSDLLTVASDTMTDEESMNGPLMNEASGPSVARGSSPLKMDEIITANTAYIHEKRSKSTVRKEKATVKRLTSWLHSRPEFGNLKDMEIETIHQLIGFWLVDLKKDSGDNYEPGTLNSYLSSLRGHLGDLGHDISKLEIVKRVWKAKAKDLKSQGKGNTPNRAGCLTATEENKLWNLELWERGTLSHCYMHCGTYSPKGLVFMVVMSPENCSLKTFS